MQIDDFIWFPNILEKIEAKHHATQDEVEEIFFNNPKFRFVESGRRANEDVYSALSQTDAGRYLIVFFILKGRTALILSAREMDDKERRLYERK